MSRLLYAHALPAALLLSHEQVVKALKDVIGQRKGGSPCQDP